MVEGAYAWNEHMLWLIPFVQASGYRVEIEYPKSHEKIVISVLFCIQSHYQDNTEAGCSITETYRKDRSITEI